jgi:hypothetical protein
VDRRVWLAIGLGVLSVLSIPAVQWAARRLPLIPLGKWPAIYASVGVAFSLALAAVTFALLHLRALERRADERLLPSAAVYAGAVLLVAGLTFASIADFARPTSAVALLLPPLLLVVLGLVGFILVSARGRNALTSKAARRIGIEVLRYVEVQLAVAVVFALCMPGQRDRLKALVLLCQGAVIAPLPLLIAHRLNRGAESLHALKCRLRSYAVALPLPVLSLLLMLPL